jgi:hypothetical protein
MHRGRGEVLPLMTDDEFKALLEDSDLPWAHFSGGEGKRYVAVSALLSLAKERGCRSTSQSSTST